ncbi:hypothetical protein GUJ93_ZPchr0012g21243 [Zizania palustris]|uniref:Uncharacterized protein n=1 Tax=Zizania palustris TaxID=103762 RepID=A0A8J5WW27_ZIZPA|nr:hypothetical protein GUJ93_ZPchr0012g21243 [Zizania palustris]
MKLTLMESPATGCQATGQSTPKYQRRPVVDGRLCKGTGSPQRINREGNNRLRTPRRETPACTRRLRTCRLTAPCSSSHTHTCLETRPREGGKSPAEQRLETCLPTASASRPINRSLFQRVVVAAMRTCLVAMLLLACDADRAAVAPRSLRLDAAATPFQVAHAHATRQL